MDKKGAEEITKNTNLLQPRSNYQMEIYFTAKGFLEGQASRDGLIRELIEALEFRSNVGNGYPAEDLIDKAKEALGER